MDFDTVDYVAAAILQNIKTVEGSKFLESRNAASFSVLFRQHFSASIKEEIIDAALRRLASVKVCAVISDNFTKDYFILSEKDADSYFDVLINKGIEPYYKAGRLGKVWMSEALKNISQLGDDADIYQTVFVPASDRIVALGDNSVVKQIEQDVGLLIESVRQSNEAAVALDRQQERIVKELAAGREIVSSGNFRIFAIFEILVKPLRYIVEKLSGSALAETAKKLIDLIFQAIL